MEIKKAIIPAAGFGTRFLPMTKVVPKELLPVVDVPMFSYAAKEAKEAEINQVVFVIPENRKTVLEYFKPKVKLEKVLKQHSKKELLERLRHTEREFEGVNFSYAVQKIPKGDGDAVLKARKQIGKGPFAVLFVDDIFDAPKPAIEQLKKIFTTSQKPVLGLKSIPREQLSAYGVVKVERIATRLYKIKGIVEKPRIDEAPLNPIKGFASNGAGLAIAGRYILTPEIFSYLTKTAPNKKGEVILAEALKLMLGDGKIIYGYEIEGEWLECGKTADWLKSHLYLCLKHPEYGPMLREFLKKIK